MLLMIASSLMTTAVVHAQEWGRAATLECTGAMHIDGDADSTAPDADSAVPHHHGTCHGPILDLASVDADSQLAFESDIRLYPARFAALAARAVDPALRPPTA
jgi:hypothetical protein